MSFTWLREPPARLLTLKIAFLSIPYLSVVIYYMILDSSAERFFLHLGLLLAQPAGMWYYVSQLFNNLEESSLSAFLYFTSLAIVVSLSYFLHSALNLLYFIKSRYWYVWWILLTLLLAVSTYGCDQIASSIQIS